MKLVLVWAVTIAGTLVTVIAQSRVDPTNLFHKVRKRVLADITRIPNYTCVETITRRNMYNQSRRRPGRQPSCSEIIRRRDARRASLPVTSWDRLRLEVAIADQNEIYSWVGASQFQEADLRKLIGYGQTAGGDFGPILAAIFEEHPEMRFLGERSYDHQRLLEFGFDTPQAQSQWKLRIGAGEFTPAYTGSVLIDADAIDVVQLTQRTAELPQESGYCESIHKDRFGRVRIGEKDALIPREARVLAVAADGSEFLNVDSFANCRQYQAESVVRFDAADPPPAATQGSAQGSVLAIPAGISFDCRIVTPIDSDTAAAGDPIQATLSSPIMSPNGAVLVASGARIHGRVMRFSSTIDAYELDVQFNSIERTGGRIPFAAMRRNGPLRTFRDVGVFVFKKKDVRLPYLDSSWITVPNVIAK